MPFYKVSNSFYINFLLVFHLQPACSSVFSLQNHDGPGWCSAINLGSSSISPLCGLISRFPCRLTPDVSGTLRQHNLQITRVKKSKRDMSVHICYKLADQQPYCVGMSRTCLVSFLKFTSCFFFFLLIIVCSSFNNAQNSIY